MEYLDVSVPDESPDYETVWFFSLRLAINFHEYAQTNWARGFIHRD